MKKHFVLMNDKLSFDKEKVANLTGEELDQVEGGVQAPVQGGDLSTHHNFTCSACTTLSGYAEA
ncbi:class I lanthipeptide [Chitinophaga sp. Hz27]|uniref:class I lanthipeptide n=1 Tax=Chitinophaga sp. Hz27 TaxID=3347169 RepID=UPI0035D917BF